MATNDNDNTYYSNVTWSNEPGGLTVTGNSLTATGMQMQMDMIQESQRRAARNVAIIGGLEYPWQIQTFSGVPDEEALCQIIQIKYGDATLAEFKKLISKSCEENSVNVWPSQAEITDMIW